MILVDLKHQQINPRRCPCRMAIEGRSVRSSARLTYLLASHFLDLPWHVGDPVGAGTGAPLGGGDETEFNDGSAGTCVAAVLRGVPKR
jgi:hypothetical protein